jgi:NADH-quinone oxidoreductase subunit L
MLAPLVLLAVLSFTGGWVGVPKFMGGHNEIATFLSPVLESPGNVGAERLQGAENGQLPAKEEEHAREEWILAGTSVAAAALGLFFAWFLYYKRPELPDRITSRMHGLYLTVLHKYYIDEAYGLIFVKPLLALSTFVFWKGVDQGIIDGMVNGAGTASKGIGNELRRMQSGNIRSYAAWVALGGAAVLAYMIWLGVGK